MTTPMSLFYIFGRNINDSHYYYYIEYTVIVPNLHIYIDSFKLTYL